MSFLGENILKLIFLRTYINLFFVVKQLAADIASNTKSQKHIGYSFCSVFSTLTAINPQMKSTFCTRVFRVPPSDNPIHKPNPAVGSFSVSEPPPVASG